jgi:hypothetical protein
MNHRIEAFTRGVEFFRRDAKDAIGLIRPFQLTAYQVQAPTAYMGYPLGLGQIVNRPAQRSGPLRHLAL